MFDVCVCARVRVYLEEISSKVSEVMAGSQVQFMNNPKHFDSKEE